MLARQDRNYTRTAEDIERKYNLGGMQKAVRNSELGLNKTNQTLEDFINATTNDLDEIRKQIDGKVDTWYLEGVPTLSNPPANEWTTDELKKEHESDLYYDTLTGKGYRFIVEDGVWRWLELPDGGVAEALATANKALDTADGKRTVFVAQPKPPYQRGDLWLKNQELYVCQIEKKDGEVFDISDFVIATKYTDDTVALGVQQELHKEYTTTADMEAKISESAEGIKTEVSNTYTTKDDFSGYVTETGKTITQIQQNANEIQTSVSKKVGNDEVISKINQSAEKITIEAQKIDVDGVLDVEKLNALGIKAGSVEAENITGTTISGKKFFANGQRIYYAKDYGETDVQRVKDIIYKVVQPTEADFEKYDIRIDGVIDVFDLLIVSKLADKVIEEKVVDTSVKIDASGDNNYLIKTPGVTVGVMGISCESAKVWEVNADHYNDANGQNIFTDTGWNSVFSGFPYWDVKARKYLNTVTLIGDSTTDGYYLSPNTFTVIGYLPEELRPEHIITTVGTLKSADGILQVQVAPDGSLGIWRLTNSNTGSTYWAFTITYPV